MGRSGTSSVARMFHHSGYFVASEADTMQGDRANPHGYYENWRIYRANEQVLADLDGSWFDAPGESRQLSLEAEQTRCLARALAVLLDAAGRSPLVLKDPRIGMLMPLWWPLLAGVLHPVLVVRHPLEVALSLERRDCTAVPVGLAMWELHLTTLLGALAGERVTVIPYRRILEEADLAERLVGEASRELAPRLRQAVQPERAPSALDPGLRRNRMDATNGVRWLSVAQQRLWELLESLEPGAALVQAPGWATATSEATRMLASYERRRQRISQEMRERSERASQELAGLDQRMAEQDRRMAEQDRRLVEQDRRLVEQDRRLVEQDRRLVEQDRRLVERERQLHVASRLCAQRESELLAAIEDCGAAERRLRVAEHWLSQVQGSLSWRATEPLRALKRRLSSWFRPNAVRQR
jgi:O-antigen biosynthesis protein